MNKYMFFLFFIACGITSVAADRPNFLVLIADDMNADSIACYGSPLRDISPNIDKLADQGYRFTDAHVASTACYPSRSAISTGRLPHRSGGEGFFFLRYPNIPTVQELLSDNGYYVGILGKLPHSTPYENTPWDFAQEMGRNTEEFYKTASKAIDEANAQKEPFYLVVNSHDPHRPYYNIDSKGTELKSRHEGKVANSHPSRVYSPEEVPVSPTVPDHPDVRHELACYYSSVNRFDDVVGRMMALLKDKGIDDNTVVFLLADHGMGMPSAKSNAYPQSTKVPFIVRWNKKYKGGVVDKRHIVSSMDILPTLLEVAGIESPGGFDGRSLVSILEGGTQEGRDKIQTQYYMTSGKNLYQIRNTQDREFSFMFNGWHSGEPTYASSSMGGACFSTMYQLGMKGDAKWKARADFLLRRTPEEFYDLKNDPECLNNLIDNPEYSQKISEYRKRMHTELKEREDQLLPVFEAYQQDRSVEVLVSSYAATMAATGIQGKAPKVVDTSRWSDPEAFKKQKQAKKRKGNSKRKKK
jgi:N-sulfoglucosamine sulfohydrolase